MEEPGPKWADDNTRRAEGLGIQCAHNRRSETFTDHCACCRELSHLDQAVYLDTAFGKSTGKVLEEPAVPPGMDYPLTGQITWCDLILVGKRMAVWQDADRLDEQILADRRGMTQKSVGDTAVVLLADDPFKNPFRAVRLQ